MNTCGTCRFYSGPAEDGFGNCHGIPGGQNDQEAALPSIPEDLETVHLRTMPSFGCTNWQDWNGKRYSEEETPPPVPQQPTTGTLLLRNGSGSSGDPLEREAVAILQARFGIDPTGIVEAATEQAICRFQRENRLEVDGVWGPVSEAKWNSLHPEK